MKKRKKITSALVLGGLAAAVPHAEAQQINTSLPLTSIGSYLMWEVGDQTMNLDVGATGHVQLDLYSPKLDQSDYRSKTYFGDEQYDDNRSNVTTTFTLRGADGKVVAQRTFKPGQHDWETFLNQELPAGSYRLSAVTTGNGKNTFALRLTGRSASIRADHLTVNVHSAEWMPVVNVKTDGPGYSLRMYDGDGPRELEARLRYADGRLVALPISATTEWVDLPLPEEAGSFVVETRQPKGAKQYSNSVGFSLQRAQQTVPLTLTQVDETGRLEVTAELLLPTGNRPTNVDVSVNSQAINVDGSWNNRVEAGDYTVEPQPVPGAEVTSSPKTVTVSKDGSAHVHVQVRPEMAIDLQADKVQLCVGDVVGFVGTASTAYTGALPYNLKLSGTGLELRGQLETDGEITAGAGAELRAEAVATEPGTHRVLLQSAMWNQEVVRTIEVLPQTTALQVRREVPSNLEPGQETTVRVLLTNTGAEEAQYNLKEEALGLTFLDGDEFSGTLQAGETREINYRVRAGQSGEATVNGAVTSGVCAVPQGVTSRITVDAPRVVHNAQRSSEVLLPFTAPRQAESLVVSHRVPEGARYVPGSARLGVTPIADPKVGGSGLLYWDIETVGLKANGNDGPLQGQVTYDLAHSDALPALERASLVAHYRGDRYEVLEGQFSRSDFQRAGTLEAQAESGRENAGAVKLPLEGTVYRTVDKVTVVVEVPQGASTALTVNGQPVDAAHVASETQDGIRGVQRLTYMGVPISAGENIIEAGGSFVKVAMAGATREIKLEPLQVVADGSSPIRVRINALDEFGNGTSQRHVTVRPNLEPYAPDASAEHGYQVELVDGVGILELRPQNVPSQLIVEADLGGHTIRESVQLLADNQTFGVGVVSATLGFGAGAQNILKDLKTYTTARAYFEGALAGGKLFVALDANAADIEARLNGNKSNAQLLAETGFGKSMLNDRDVFERYSKAGDASIQSSPLKSDDPIAVVYDHSAFQASYQRTNPPISVLPLGETFTTATLKTKANPELSAFVAALPSDRIKKTVELNGTRILHLDQADILEGSESLELVYYKAGKETHRQRLVNLVDYTIDHRAGVVTFVRDVTRLTPNFEDVKVQASYRLDSAAAMAYKNRKLAYGAQAVMSGTDWSAGVAAANMPNVHGNMLTAGARGKYDNGKGITADARVAYATGDALVIDPNDPNAQIVGKSSGVSAFVEARAKLNERSEKLVDTLTLQALYQQEGYKGLGAGTPGLTASAAYRAVITEQLSAEVGAEHRTSADLKNVTKGSGSARAMADYHMGQFSAGGGARYRWGEKSGLAAVGRLGYNGNPLSASVEHEQRVMGDINTVTTLGAGYRVNNATTLRLRDVYTWNGDNAGHRASLGLDSRHGNTNYSVGYELPTASGDGNRARFGVSTNVPLGENLSAGLRGDASYGIAKKDLNASAGADLHYRAERYTATVGGDVAYRLAEAQDAEIRTAVRGGVSGSLTDDLTVSADALAEFKGKDNGQRATLSYAYRGDTISSLGYARLKNGTLAGGKDKSEFTTGVSAEYRQPNWAVRVGNDTYMQLQDKNSFSGHAYVGGNYYLNDRFGVGAWGRGFYQPAAQGNDKVLLGYGLEGNARVLPGTWLSAGYNFAGFNNLPSASTYTKKGPYVRLDMTLDEMALGAKKQ